MSKEKERNVVESCINTGCNEYNEAYEGNCRNICVNKKINNMSKEKQKIEWIDCPVCGKPDMRKEYTLHEGYPTIFCANHACGSNGGNNFSAVPNINPEQPPESNIKRFHACVVDGDEVCNCVLDKDGEFTRSDCTIAEGDESILSREDCVNWQLVEHLDESVEVQQLKADNLTFKSMLESTQDREVGYKAIVARLKKDTCEICSGTGRTIYCSGATWRRGVGGASMSEDVCDKCWGSGRKSVRGTNLREFEKRFNDIISDYRKTAKAKEAEIAQLKAELREADIQFKELSEIAEASVNRLEELDENTGQEETMCSAQGFCEYFDGEACLTKECRGKPTRM